MFSNPASHENPMGRWSRRLAISFIEISGVENGERRVEEAALSRWTGPRSG